MSQQQPDRQDLQAAQAQLADARTKGRQRFGQLLGQARTELAYARAQQAHWQGERARLAAFATDASKPEHNTYVSVDLLAQAYEAMGTMQKIAIGLFEHNLQVIATVETPAPSALRVPARTFAWVEQKCRFDLAMARYLMRYNAPGVDAVLRATGHDGTIKPVGPAHAAERNAEVAAVTQAAEASRLCWTFTEKLGADLAEVRRVNRWAIEGFERWPAMDVAARQAFLRHPDWTRLANHLPLLRELHERCGAHQALRTRFVAWSAERPAFATQPARSAAPASKASGLSLPDGPGSWWQKLRA